MDHVGYVLTSGLVAVTGAAGYLGNEVMRALKSLGLDSVGLARRAGDSIIACDLLDRSRLRDVLREMQPRCVIHCAWETPKSAGDYADVSSGERGLSIIDSLLDATRAPVIYASSMTVYGQNSGQVARSESDAGAPESAYGLAKWRAERLFEDRGAKGFAARLPGLFGGQRKAGLVWAAIDALERGELPTLPKYPVMWAGADVRDVAKALAQLCVEQPMGFTAINLGYSGVHSVSHLVETLSQVYGVDIPYEIKHPEFAFDLELAASHGLIIENDLRSAVLRLKDEWK